MNSKLESALVWAIFTMVGAFLTIAGFTLGQSLMQKQAIAAGLAEYRTVNPASRKTEFVWKARDNKDAALAWEREAVEKDLITHLSKEYPSCTTIVAGEIRDFFRARREGGSK